MVKQPGGHIDESYLQHYNLLKEIGLWDYVSELEEENHDLERFFTEALEMMNTHSVQGLIEYVISCFLDKFVPEHLLFIVEEPGTGLPRTHYFRHLKSEALSIAVPWYNELKALFSGRSLPLDIREIAAGKDSGGIVESLRAYSTEMILPMKGIGGVYGLVLFGKKVVEKAYTAREIAYIHRLTRFFSVCLQNSLHHQSSITDAKTGLFNHAYFMKRLEEELVRAHRHRTETGLLLIDIDHFKLFNDRYGHLVGDIVLAEVARKLKTFIRSEDVLARFGGEEFTLLVPDCSLATLEEIAGRLRATIERMETDYDDEKLRVTISIGCGHSSATDILPPRELIARADLALYRSKADGRNRTTLYRKGLAFDRF